MPDIKNVEIFAVGTWNGRKYTDKDLQAIVDSFGEVGFEPPLKLGHNDKQKLLQKDGMPAAGWVEAIKKVGDKLFVDLKDIPKKIYQLIKNKAYKTKSVEIYHDLKLENGKVFPHVLKAVALLGADIPAVESLKDVLALYDDDGRPYQAIAFEENNFDKGVTVTSGKNKQRKEEGNIMPKEEDKNKEAGAMEKLKARIQELEKMLAAATSKNEKVQELESQLKEATSKNEKKENEKKMSSEKQEEFSKKLDNLSTELEETRKELAGEKHKGKVEAVDKAVDTYVREAKITPAQSVIVKSMLMASNGNTEVKLFSKDGKEETCSITAAIDKFISIQPDVFDAKLHTKEGLDTDDIEARIASYCKEKNFDINNTEHYKQAYSVVGSDA